MRYRSWVVGSFVILAISGIVALARPVWIPGYKEMTEKSDLVVIATPVARKELPGRTVMPGVQRDNKPIPAVQIETTFHIAVVLRGQVPAGQEQFTLLHLLDADPPPGGGANALELVDFQPNSGNEYLLFLKRLGDGRYEAMNGQTDPAISVKRLVRPELPSAARP